MRALTAEPHWRGNYLTYTHNSVNRLSATKSSNPWPGMENSATRYTTRGCDLVMESMRSPKTPAEDFQQSSVICVYESTETAWIIVELNLSRGSPNKNPKHHTLFNLVTVEDFSDSWLTEATLTELLINRNMIQQWHNYTVWTSSCGLLFWRSWAIFL